MNLEHMADLLRRLPAYTDAACSPGQVADRALLIHLAARAAHSTRRIASYDTRVPTGNLSHWFPLFNTAFARLPMLGVGSSSEDQVWLEGGQAETQTADRQGQRCMDLLGVRKWRVPGRPAERP